MAGPKWSPLHPQPYRGKNHHKKRRRAPHLSIKAVSLPTELQRNTLEHLCHSLKRRTTHVWCKECTTKIHTTTTPTVYFAKAVVLSLYVERNVKGPARFQRLLEKILSFVWWRRDEPPNASITRIRPWYGDIDKSIQDEG